MAGSSAGDEERIPRAVAGKRALERLGLHRLPGYEPATRWLRSSLAPGLARRAASRQEVWVEVEAHGLVLEVPEPFAPQFAAGTYEPEVVSEVLSTVGEGETVVDVGAHLGLFTLLAARAVGPAGAVHAFEPAPRQREALERNARRNGIANVVVHPIVASARAGTRTLRLMSSSGCNSLYAHPLRPTVARIRVPARPVDDVLPSTRASLIKIDVEGAEPEVLTGMRGLLSRSAGATVIAEWNPGCLRAAGADPADLPALLEELGVTDLVVLDDFQVGVGPAVEDVRRQVAEGSTDREWVVNLRGVVQDRPAPRSASR